MCGRGAFVRASRGSLTTECMDRPADSMIRVCTAWVLVDLEVPALPRGQCGGRAAPLLPEHSCLSQCHRNNPIGGKTPCGFPASAALRSVFCTSDADLAVAVQVGIGLADAITGRSSARWRGVCTLRPREGWTSASLSRTAAVKGWMSRHRDGDGDGACDVRLFEVGTLD